MESLILAIGGLLGSALKSWMTSTQATWSKQSLADVIIGAAIGLLYPLFPLVPFPDGASLAQKGAILFVLSYFGADLLTNLFQRLGMKTPGKLPVVLLLLLPTLTACGHPAAMIEALSKDKASLCHRLTSIYGTSTLVRVGEGSRAAFGPDCAVK